MQIRVSSETGSLRGVVVHTPGREVSLVNPEIKDELLFDDIIFETDARREHLAMLDIFKAAMPEDGQVFEITDLIKEAFKKADARQFFVESLFDVYPNEGLSAFEEELIDLSAHHLYEFAIYGKVQGIPFNLNPSPNLLFTRDLAAVINDGIIISRAAKLARARESILMEMLVKFHPLFASVKEKSFRLNFYDTIEGGDILIPNEKLVLVGMSERSSISGIMKAAQAMFDFGVEDVLIVDIPKQRASMHLDTIFTFASRNECIVYPPSIMDKSDNVVHLSRKNSGEMVTKLRVSLKRALEEITGESMTFIKCGGDSKANQQREQWTDGANVFALADGVIVGYERNIYTFEALSKHGYEVLTQEEFIARFRGKGIQPNDSQKIAVSFIGNELCRGRGGARCMTMPISRI